MGIRLLTLTMPVDRAPLPFHKEIITDVLKSKFNITNVKVLEVVMGTWWRDLSPGFVPIERDVTELVVSFQIDGGEVRSFSAERESLRAIMNYGQPSENESFLACTFRVKYDDISLVFTSYPAGEDNSKEDDLYVEHENHPLDYTTDDVLLFTASALNSINKIIQSEKKE